MVLQSCIPSFVLRNTLQNLSGTDPATLLKVIPCEVGRKPSGNSVRKETIKLYSVNDNVLRHITVREAFAMLAEGTVDPVKNIKREIVAVQMKTLERNQGSSACTITRSETENNAFVHEGVKLSAKDSIGALERAIAKIKAWPDVHDERATVISAGKALGVFCPYPKYQERVVTFA